ncbi:MAG: hypothetical protein ACI8WB_003502 [Phenylobacterium sp.]|jgi:hypothetical protein
MYLLDLNKLQVGDIILQSGDTKIVSDLIKKITNSDYSHAMIYVDFTLIHAVTGGVFSKNPQRILVKGKNDLKVLRIRNEVNSSTIETVADFARSLIGSLYSKREAIAAVNCGENKIANNKQFCSRLVAQCYDSQGISLVENTDYCTPEDLNTSPILIEVNDCVRAAEPADLEMNERKDPNLEHQKETFKWLKNARNLFKKEGIEIQTLNDVDQGLIDNRKLDKRICKYIEKTKYLEQYSTDRVANKYRYKMTDFLERLNSDPNQQEFISQEIKLNEGEVNRHSKNFAIANKNYKQSKLKFAKLNKKLHRNVLLESKTRLTVIEQALSIGLDKSNVKSLINQIDETLG